MLRLRIVNRISVLIIGCLVCGCTFRGSIPTNFYKGSHAGQPKIPLCVVLDDTGSDIDEIYTNGMRHTSYHIEVSRGLLSAIQTALQDLFTRVVLESQLEQDLKPDLVVVPACRIRQLYPGAYGFMYELDLVFQMMDTVVAEYSDAQEVHVSTTASATVLTVFNFMVLGVLSPIIVPSRTQIEGSRRIKLGKRYFTKSIDVLSKEIYRDRSRLIAAVSALKSTTVADGRSKRQKKGPQVRSLPSKYADFIKCVVVVRSHEGEGSGFFVSPDGNIITNAHVVGKDRSVAIKHHDGQTSMGMVIARDERADLALVKTSGNGFNWLPLGKLSDADIGMDVLAIGTPQGLSWSVSKGIVSAIRTDKDIIYIQTDAALNPGNSGGPLISMTNGKAIGVITFGYRKDVSEGLSFAVFVGRISDVFPQIQ